MAKTKTALATIVGQLPAARARSEREREAGRRAISARYDHRAKRWMMELPNGSIFGFTVAMVPALG